MNKVANDRICVELDKILLGRNPHKAIQSMNEFQILPMVIKLPTQFDELKGKDTSEYFNESTQICHILGVLFSSLKANASALDIQKLCNLEFENCTNKNA